MSEKKEPKCDAPLPDAALESYVRCGLVDGHSWSHEVTVGDMSYRWGDMGRRTDPEGKLK